MLFSSSIFLFFFLPIVIIGYQLTKENLRIYFLMIASLFFYGWGEPKHLLIIGFSIFANYISGLLMHITHGKKPILRKAILFMALALNLCPLLYFKYTNFAFSSINHFFGIPFTLRNIVLPIGISFFSFKGISYVVDVNKGRIPAEKNPSFVAFYIAFFPQLLAGPIVRYKNVKEQMGNRSTSVEAIANGVKRFVIGLAKKVILANTLGNVADQIFANPAVNHTPATAWLGIFCYTFQIYIDFSGYSDMAIGLAAMFGFRSPENFDYPYIAHSLSDFWKRWHMTLSLWFRDYVYFPLSGYLMKRKWKKRSIYIFSSLTVWLLTGLWHGASFHFLVWGLWHGFFLLLERSLESFDAKKKFLMPVKHLITMLIVIVGWVLFRANSLQEAISYTGIMFGLIEPQNVGFTVWYYVDTKVVCALAISMIISFPLAKCKGLSTVYNHPTWKYASAILTLLLFFAAIVFVVASSYNTFIYFQF